jgi:hypothetical protein
MFDSSLVLQPSLTPVRERDIGTLIEKFRQGPNALAYHDKL